LRRTNLIDFILVPNWRFGGSLKKNAGRKPSKRGIGTPRNNSTFQGILPIAKKYKVGAINWGLVAGKTQTFLPWDSWQKPYVNREPAVWFHEVFRTDGTPYRPDEVEFIREMTGAKARRKAA
jgi:hypothetical protein